jgi:hypothetical protein
MRGMSTELSYVFKQIVTKSQVSIYYDDSDLINIVIPEIPEGVACRQQLLKYLNIYHRIGQGRHYDEELGTAILFGCGK